MTVDEPLEAPSWSDGLLAAARAGAGTAGAAIEIAGEYGDQLPIPGRGQTAQRWAVLAAAAEVDLTVARVLEAHSDALAILAEAGESAPPGTWGVFAAEAPGVTLDAHGATHATTRLHGTKPWCSLAQRLDSALVTARTGEDRGLFAVDLHDPSVRADDAAGWVARGLVEVPSGPVHFDATPARALGPPGWYLSRPGFAWGGIGVAACWLGGARALAATLRRAAAERGGELRALHVGTVDVALHAATTAMRDAACRIDTGAATGQAGELLALRVRAVVAHAAELTIAQVGHALGPAPLTFDAEHARRVADLEIYLRQHHGERDLAALGGLLIGDESR